MTLNIVWKLWLDDQINDPSTPDRHLPIGEEWKGAASSAEAINLVETYGPPIFMDLDHDLGGEDTSKVFLKWLATNYYNNPPAYHVHSKNVEGKPWIDSFINSWNKSLR